MGDFVASMLRAWAFWGGSLSSMGFDSDVELLTAENGDRPGKRLNFHQIVASIKAERL